MLVVIEVPTVDSAEVNGSETGSQIRHDVYHQQ